MVKRSVYSEILNADIDYDDAMYDEARALASAEGYESQLGDLKKSYMADAGFEEPAQQATAQPEKEGLLTQGLKGLGAFSEGVGEGVVPGMGHVKSGVQGLLDKIGLPAPDTSLAEESPMAYQAGEKAPDLVRAIATYYAGAGAIPGLQAAKGAQGVGRLLNVAKGVGSGVVGNVPAGMVARSGEAMREPSLENAAKIVDPKSMLLDTGVGGLFGGAGAIATELKALAGPLWKGALKGGTTAKEVDKLASAAETAASQKGVSLTLKGLSKKADKQTKPLIDKLDVILKKIGGKKTDPKMVIDELQGLKKQFLSPSGRPIEGTSTYRKVIDKVINEYKSGIKEFGSESVAGAQDAKKKIWRMTADIFEKSGLEPTQKVAKQAMGSAGTGRKLGIEKVAKEQLGLKEGSKVAEINKQLGDLMGLRDVAKTAAGKKGSAGKYATALFGLGGIGAGYGGSKSGAGALGTMALLATPTGRMLAAQGLGKGLPALNKLLQFGAPATSFGVAKIRGE